MLPNNCIENSQLWALIKSLEKRNNTKIVLTPQQRYALCYYMNGLPFDRKVLAPFFK
jgi:hypothetical protein